VQYRASALTSLSATRLARLAVLYLTDDDDGDDGSAVVVPDVESEPLDDARAEVEAFGLPVRVVGQSSYTEISRSPGRRSRPSRRRRPGRRSRPTPP
jgi:hypothetical protein